MDTEILVEKKNDGDRLIRQLMRDRFDVEAAFWVRIQDDGLWTLYIASTTVNTASPHEAYRTVYAALDKIPECSIGPSEVTLLAPTDPIARDAIALRDRYPNRVVKYYQSKRLGNLTTRELWLYPRISPLAVRELADGRWEVNISELDDLWIACDSEEDAQVIAAARVLEFEALNRIRKVQIQELLKKTKSVMDKYRLSLGSGILQGLAQEVHQ